MILVALAFPPSVQLRAFAAVRPQLRRRARGLMARMRARAAWLLLASAGIAPARAAAAQAESPGGSRIVAHLELAAPRVTPFVMHATLPIPKGVFPRADGRSPFSIRFAGTPPKVVPAQVEIVSRYPTGEADVVELVAFGEYSSDVRPGARLGCSVLLDEAPVGADEAEVAAGKAGAAPAITAAVAELLDRTKRGNLFLRTHDVYGNLYAAEITGNPAGSGFGSDVVLKRGRWLEERRVYATLVPLPGRGGAEKSGDPLPHLMGVHAYLTTFAGLDAVALDLRVNNGAVAGSREASPLETPLGIVYWNALELVLPKGWTAVEEVRDPFLGESHDEGDRRVLQIVKPLPNGALHMMGPQAQFERRFVLVPKGKETLARALLGFEGLAFAVRAEQSWSWSNPETARFFPQRDVLASIDFLKRGQLTGKAAARAQDAENLRDLRAALETGAPHGWYVEARVMGWAHPWFIKEQGGVGGEGIALFEGYYAAQAASREGLAYLSLLHRMNVCRQPEAAYDAHGAIVGYQRWLTKEGLIPFDYRTHGGVVMPAFLLPMKGGAPASEQVREVVKRGLRPPYDLGNPFEKDGWVPDQNEALLAWWPHDDQHLVRYTKNTKALVWLANDALAKDDLLLSAELFRLMFHESAHVEASWSPGLTLRLWEKVVAEHPHQGLPLGREHAWGIDAMCAAYSTADPEWRARQRPWFDRVSKLLHDGAMPSGLIQRTLNERLLDGKYTATQCFESLFLIHAIRCMNESVFRGVDDVRRAALEKLALRAVDYLYFGPPWQRIPSDWQPDPAQPSIFFQGPRQAIAISLNDERATPPFCDATRWGKDYLPKDGLGGGVELFHVWAALDYAQEISAGSAGVGLHNRYLRRTLDCWTPHATFPELLHALYEQASDPSADNSANWIGLVGKLQSLGVR